MDPAGRSRRGQGGPGPRPRLEPGAGPAAAVSVSVFRPPQRPAVAAGEAETAGCAPFGAEPAESAPRSCRAASLRPPQSRNPSPPRLRPSSLRTPGPAPAARASPP
ncbi:atherin-like [Choloepus didactylus]|uniref:atherin-like n=1 Tax=Choloepus didactylus TaxID=27675 RepID=UPI00189F64DD|nr:atherin-like [Choloepus didactylus]